MKAADKKVALLNRIGKFDDCGDSLTDSGCCDLSCRLGLVLPRAATALVNQSSWPVRKVTTDNWHDSAHPSQTKKECAFGEMDDQYCTRR